MTERVASSVERTERMVLASVRRPLTSTDRSGTTGHPPGFVGSRTSGRSEPVRRRRRERRRTGPESLAEGGRQLLVGVLQRLGGLGEVLAHAVETLDGLVDAGVELLVGGLEGLRGLV